MINLRQAQLDQMSASMSCKFEARLAKHLRDTFPERTADMPEEVMLQTVRLGIQDAGKFGIELQDDIRRFMELVLTYGNQFNTDSGKQWVAEILLRADLDGTEKMDLIDMSEISLEGGQT